MNITPEQSITQMQTIINNNNEIVFEPGIYNITRALIIPSNRKIVLQKGAILKRKSGCNVFTTYHTSKTTKYNGAKNILITGEGTIKGIDSVNTYCNFISLFHSSDVTIKDIIIKDIQGSHAIEINSSEHVLIDGVNFNGYRTNPEGSFREAVQIDFANATGLPLVADKNAACYDLTCCNDITVKDCRFVASTKYPAPNSAIGTHTRPISTNKHKNIRILDNYAEGGEYSGHFASIINMDNVTIKNNEVHGYTRFARITAMEKGYYADGTTANVDTTAGEGISKTIIISDNKIIDPSGSYVCPGILCQGYGSKRHKDIIIYNNTFETKKSSAATQYVNLGYTKGSLVVNNQINGKALICKTYKTTTSDEIVIE